MTSLLAGTDAVGEMSCRGSSATVGRNAFAGAGQTVSGYLPEYGVVQNETTLQAWQLPAFSSSAPLLLVWPDAELHWLRPAWRSEQEGRESFSRSLTPTFAACCVGSSRAESRLSRPTA